MFRIGVGVGFIILGLNFVLWGGTYNLCCGLLTTIGGVLVILRK